MKDDTRPSQETELRTDRSLKAGGWIRLPADFARFPQHVYLREGTIYAPSVVATTFGGPSDKEDNSQMASGKRSDVSRDYCAVSLPLPTARGCHGTPLPVFPWGTEVIIAREERQFFWPLMECGPSGGLPSGAFVDLTPGAMQAVYGLPMNTWKPAHGQAVVSLTIKLKGEWARTWIAKVEESLRTVQAAA